MKNIEREGNVPNTFRKTVVFGIALLFVISSAMAIQNVNITKDIDENELEVRSGLYGLSGGTWWNSSFEYRKLITINHSQVDATLSNFPVLVYRNTDGDLSSHAQTDGDDIAFVLYSDNSTQLNHEIENYSNGTLWTWVNVTSLSSSIDTKIWMYYGNDTCSSQESIGGVWNSGYNAVYHMNDIASNDKIEDSTENSYDSIETKRTPDYEQTGKISTAVYYFDREAHIIPDDVLAENPTEFTVSCWINFHSFARNKQHLIALLENTNIKLLAENIDDDDDVYKAALIVRNGGDNKAYGTITLNTDTWYYLVGTYDGENITIYTNGGDAQSTTCTSIKQEGKGNLVGARDGERENAFGDIDEVRISKKERNAGWTSTCFANQNDPVSFLAVGGEEEPNKPPYMPSNPYPAQGSTSVNINVDLSWTGGDPDGDPVTYDVYWGTSSTPPKIASNQSATSYDPGTLELEKTYYWKIIAWDSHSAFTESPIWWFSTGTNQPPSQPIILSGPTFGRSEDQLDFSTVSMDPEGDQIYYMWDWGDGELSGWLGPFISGQTTEAHHTWDDSGEFEIKVKTKDSNDAESYWSEPVQIIIENNPPNIEIIQPLPNVLYFVNSPLLSFFTTLIIGPIDIIVNTYDNTSGMDRVEFYIKDSLKKTDTSAPYIWLWRDITFGLKAHDIKVITYDNAGNHANDTIMVWKIL